jgi:hypothetical protein
VDSLLLVVVGSHRGPGEPMLPNAGESIPLENIALLTRPTPARRDSLVPRRRSRVAQRLNEGSSEVGNAGGAYPFAKIHSKSERPTRSAVRTSSPLRSLRPCWTVFLSILSSCDINTNM